MNYFERMLLNYLLDSKIEMEITGFDMDSFESALRQEFKCQLEMVEYIVFSDDELASDAEKIQSLKELFQNDFYGKD